MQTAQEAAATAAASAAARGSTGTDVAGGVAGGNSAGPASPISAGSPAATDPTSGAAGPSGSDAPPGVDGSGASGGGDSVEPAAGAAAAAESCLLLDLEKKPLLKVFVFLNATEVLRAAQVCRPMFRKVRGLRGRCGDAFAFVVRSCLCAFAFVLLLAISAAPDLCTAVDTSVFYGLGAVGDWVFGAGFGEGKRRGGSLGSVFAAGS